MVEAACTRMALGAGESIVADTAAGVGSMLSGGRNIGRRSGVTGTAGRLAAVGNNPRWVYRAIGAGPLAVAIDIAGGTIAGAGIDDGVGFAGNKTVGRSAAKGRTSAKGAEGNWSGKAGPVAIVDIEANLDGFAHRRHGIAAVASGALHSFTCHVC